MSSAEREYCFYCDAPIRKNGVEWDHFPIPDRNGGTQMVPSCQTCHDLKDRFHIGSWSVKMIPKIIEYFPKLNRETSLFLARALASMSDYSAQQNKESDT